MARTAAPSKAIVVDDDDYLDFGPDFTDDREVDSRHLSDHGWRWDLDD